MQKYYNNKQFFVIILFLLTIFLKAETSRAVDHELFFVVHCEALNDQLIDTTFKKGLEPLVHLADSYNVKLTISLSPQWAQYFLKNPLTLYKVRQWIQNNHEIGTLHYGLNHEPTWDYYTNETDPQIIKKAKRDPNKKRGSMIDLINEVNALLLSPDIQATPAKQMSLHPSDYETDMLPGTPIKYLSAGYRISDDPMNQDVVKKPMKINIHGVYYWRLSMGYFTSMHKSGIGIDHISSIISTLFHFSKNSLFKNNIPDDECNLSCLRLSVRYFTTLLPTNCSDKQLLKDVFTLYDFLKKSTLTKDNPEYKFGLATHPLDFIADNPLNGGCGYFQQLFHFIGKKIHSSELTSKTVSQILNAYP
jgi:hypothetical protein